MEYYNGKSRYKFLTKHELDKIEKSNIKGLIQRYADINFKRENFSELAEHIQKNHKLYDSLRQYKSMLSSVYRGNVSLAYLDFKLLNPELKIDFDSFKDIIISINPNKGYGVNNRYVATLSFFQQKFDQIISDFTLTKFPVRESDEITIEKMKDIFVKRICYALCYSDLMESKIYKDLYNQDVDQKNQIVLTLDGTKDLILTYRLILNCDSFFASCCDSVDDHFNRPRHYNIPISLCDQYTLADWKQTAEEKFEVLKK